MRSFSSDALTSALLPLQAIEEDYARSEGHLNDAKNKPDPDMELESKLACHQLFLTAMLLMHLLC